MLVSTSMMWSRSYAFLDTSNDVSRPVNMLNTSGVSYAKQLKRIEGSRVPSEYRRYSQVEGRSFLNTPD